jgi:hypothetical protein
MSDAYFAQELHLVAVYEFDKEASIAFYQSQKCYGAWCCGIWAGCICPLCIYYSCDRANVRDEVNARHVCITHDGIKYVVDKHPSSCRLSQCDVGKVSKTVPFDKITDCDIEEPAGAEWCGLLPKVLSRVNIDTASGRDIVLEARTLPCDEWTTIHKRTAFGSPA